MMDQHTTESTKTARSADTVSFSGLMEPCTEVIGLMTTFMAKEHTNGQTADHMLDNGIATCSTEEVLIHGPTERNTRESM